VSGSASRGINNRPSEISRSRRELDAPINAVACHCQEPQSPARHIGPSSAVTYACARDARPVGLDQTPVAPLRAGIGEQPRLERGIGQPVGQWPIQAGSLKRLIVVRTVDGATPIRRATSRVGTPPTNFNRCTSRTLAHGRSLCWHPVLQSSFGTRRSGPKSASRGNRPPGRDIPEWSATSSRNGGRHYPGTTGDFSRNRHQTAPRLCSCFNSC
jgi:hypothetical protein